MMDRGKRDFTIEVIQAMFGKPKKKKKKKVNAVVTGSALGLGMPRHLRKEAENAG